MYTMEQKRFNPWQPTNRDKKRAAEYVRERRASKVEWLQHHQERRPVFTPINEEGAFAGLIGFGTAGGARIFPYYRTKNGVNFYELEVESEENPSRREKKVIQLDLEEIRRKGIAKLYTPESFLENPKVIQRNSSSSQGNTPGDTR